MTGSLTTSTRLRRNRPGLALLSLLLPLVAPAAGRAATLPSGFAETQVAGGMVNPTLLAVAPDGRVFVSEQGGRLRVIENGSLLSTPFVTLTVSSSGERGLLGVTFDPDFAINKWVYVYYTATSPTIHNRVSRFTASGDVASGGEVQIFNLPTLSSATNHNGGSIHFGIDGKLYISVGDNANGANAQSMSTTLGKMLRISKDGTIPVDNPFYGSTSGNNRAIWALGLRNPFTFAVQPGTGRIYVNDVGQNKDTGSEEIDEGSPGANFGWPTVQGNSSDPRFKNPVYRYTTATNACAITGGDFYNPATVTFPSSYVGKYFFTDYCGNWIKYIDPATRTVSTFATNVNKPTDAEVAPDGSLYYIARGSGAVFRVRPSGCAPTISVQPQSQRVGIGQTAKFCVQASGQAPLSYQWQRNQVDIPGAISSCYSFTAAASDDGDRFRAKVSNSCGSATSAEATLSVPGMAPVATIIQPPSGTQYSGGETIAYAGDATDAEDTMVPASGFSWLIVLHHAEHTHPFLGPINGAKNGTFTIPDRGELDPNQWYRIHLTVTDSTGLTHTTFRDISPRTSTITLATNPTGLQVTVDGQPGIAPTTFTSVEGMFVGIGTSSPQTSGGTTWNFQSWSDGGAMNHDVRMPPINTTHTATFTSGGGPTYVWKEAESGTITSPMQVQSDTSASGGKYVTVAAGNNSQTTPPGSGYTTLSFSVTTAGTYKVWGRVIAPTTSDDSFWVRMDGGAWTNWNNITPGAAWHWDDVHDAAAANALVTYNLTAGTHTLTVAYREDGTRLDRVLVTNDLTFVPIDAPTTSLIWVEAEGGTVSSPMQSLSDTAASGGRYVTVAAGSNSQTSAPTSGYAAVTFNVTTAGIYKVWGRVIAPTTSDDSFWVKMDGGSWIKWNGIALGTGWHWDELHNSDASGAVVTFNLTAGTHTLTIAYREDGTKLDRLLITSDLTFVPTGLGQ